ncbi:4-alpha-glucanotransferase [Austwickia sp. TVS 96-490-7B]|uniref:4-alpha-glucanotransferase n=1 Tax=Austwickia sp. TVS 96-490-7B TaxID=2830843 RepID=UPI001C57AFFC|nr:4-alpha-glucanotransferase [Austwickia sp. TVS 96-490-7B]MBW3086525.1 4-alpha-glucanotransferase [Austwickia sp. TVS 96-490-7B]
MTSALPDEIPSVPLADLARASGVATEYWDWQGRHVVVGADTIRTVLAALGIDAATPEQIDAALNDHELAPWRQRLPHTTLTRQGQPAHVPVHVPHGSPVEVWIELEDRAGRREVRQLEHNVPPRQVDDLLIGEALFEIPADFPLGWHTLCAQVPGDPLASAPLIVVPTALTLPPAVAARGAAGLMTQLYALRSTQSWGVGDLADLADLSVWAARDLNFDFTLVNPLHAAEPVAPMEPSPYLPTSRRFVNPVYLRVEDIPEVATLPPEVRARVESLAEQARALNLRDTIDRDTAWQLKRAALRLIHDAPRPVRRQLSFDAFCEREGQGLDDFATWCALADAHGTTDWPRELQHVDDPAVTAERARLAPEITFHRWLQWVLDDQLAQVHRLARAAGMTIGVMNDLAVGVHPEGADAWGLGDALARGVTVGAPPDPYNQLGQDWSQPPWRPDRLAELGYAPYRDMVRAALRHAGALRIDHVIGLFRLWWVPQGSDPRHGTYVRFDHEALVGILVLEAHRAGAVVVGEDLGTVEPWVREYLKERGVLGTSILWFERDEQGQPLPPEAYRRLCLASVTTHDLPPTAGYLTGEHMDVRERLGLFTRPVEVERAEDDADRERMLDALRSRGLLGDDESLPKVVEALHRYVSWSPALLVGVSVSDLVGDRRTINQPGTDEEYPNWRVPLAGPDRQPLLLEHVLADPAVRRLPTAVQRG